jgi:hypothetical protein
MNESRRGADLPPVAEREASGFAGVAWHFTDSPSATRNWVVVLASVVIGWAVLMASAFGLGF